MSISSFFLIFHDHFNNPRVQIILITICRWVQLPLSIFDNREGNGNPLQYSCLENLMDGGAWWAAVHGVTRSRTRLNDFTFTFHFHTLEKEMATHSNALVWRILGMEEPGGLPSLRSHRVGHDWSDLAAAAAAPKSVVHGLTALVSLWGLSD